MELPVNRTPDSFGYKLGMEYSVQASSSSPRLFAKYIGDGRFKVHSNRAEYITMPVWAEEVNIPITGITV